MHSFSRHIGRSALGSSRDLVDLVEEDDPRTLDPCNCFGFHGVHVYESGAFFLFEDLQGVGHLHFARLGPRGDEVGEHFSQVEANFLHPLRGHDLDAR